MAIGKIVYAAVTIALSYLAQRLLAPKPPKAPLDDSRTEPSERGTLLGLLVGHFRIGPVIGFVGGRYTVEEKTEGGGGKGGGGDDPTQTVYYERGWHLLNCGEGRSLRRIYQNGKAIWQGELTPDTYPSGTSVDLGTEGSFTIYWGELAQPINTDLASYIGVSSRWPTTFYIWWDHKRLGTSAVWPSLEYEITAAPSGTGAVTGDEFFVLDESGYTDIAFSTYTRVSTDDDGTETVYDRSYSWNQLRVTSESAMADLEVGMDLNIKDELDAVIFRAEVTEISRTGGYTYIYFNSPLPLTNFNTTTTTSGWFSSSDLLNSDAFTDQGASPAITIEQFLFQPRPWGAGLDSDLFDSSLQTIQDLMVSEGTPSTTLLRSGRSWKDGLASIMQDMGIMFVFNTTTGLYGFRALRDEDSVTEISEAYYDGDGLVESYAYAVLASDSRVFSYKDSARNFATSTLPATDDAQAQYGADPNVKTVALETVTSYKPASRIAARRDSELSIDGAITLKCSHLFNAEVGTSLTLADQSQIYRLVSIETNPDEAYRSLGLVEDAYITGSDYTISTPQGLNPSNRASVVPDISVKIIEVSRFTNPDTNGYHILRIRDTQLSKAAVIYDSADNASYTKNGETISGTGGVLTEAMGVTGGNIVETGPIVELFGDDIDKILDLSSSEEEWRSGMQLCFIGAEVFYLRNISVTGTDPITFRLEGLIRARFGTNIQAHAVDNIVHIVLKSNLDIFNQSWILDGQDVYVKALPYNDTSITAIENVEAVTLLPYTGGGYRPLTPENLNTTNNAYAWVSGDDAELRWDYKNANAATGAGFSLSDEPSELAPPEGYFKITILDGTTIVREETSTTSTFTYTQAMMTTDFGSEPTTFNVEVVEVLNGLTSIADTATIVRV
jgi:hypothetical protein